MSDLIRISTSDDWTVDYDRERGMYRVSYFQDNHFVDEHWFDAFEEKEVPMGFPECFVGNTVYYPFYNGELVKCKVSMLQQKADKSWKVRLSSQNHGVFDITLDEFNTHCYFTKEERK